FLLTMASENLNDKVAVFKKLKSKSDNKVTHIL
ncbi:hypothetical protein HID58_016056, partial [Brassica napus]